MSSLGACEKVCRTRTAEMLLCMSASNMSVESNVINDRVDGLLGLCVSGGERHLEVRTGWMDGWTCGTYRSGRMDGRRAERTAAVTNS